MALNAMVTVDLEKYVSRLDPARTSKEVPIDPAHPELGTKTEDVIDWDNATIFKLRPLENQLLTALYDGVQVVRSGPQGNEVSTRFGQSNYDAVRFGLAGWENFKAGPNLIAMKTETTVFLGREYTVVSADSMNKLGVRLTSELGSRIKEISEVTAVEEKNSSGASLPSG